MMMSLKFFFFFLIYVLIFNVMDVNAGCAIVFLLG